MTDVTIPNHIGFIIDGNRRWAKKHGLPPYEGHLAGYNALRDIVVEAADSGVKFISLYTFSTENWNRAKEEVSNIMALMMRLFKTDVHLLLENDLRLVVLGSRERLPKRMRDAIDSVEMQTAHCKKSTVAVCFNYGGQQEIVAAVKQIVEQKIAASDITPELISKNLYRPEVPEIDLIVRTSGEKRLSNFMLWRSPYSELLFLDKFWPDMKKTDVADILEEYNNRYRRFGG
jgi:undecaprenyl diphosphate synthase